MKAYTDLEQSKKLAEILPLESADMYYILMPDGVYNHFPLTGRKTELAENTDIPCWSLAALLNILPKVINNETLFIETSPALWHIGYRNIYTARADNPVNACFELITKLNELNLL